MFREDLAWEMISRTIAGDDKGLTPLEKKQYDRQRASYLKDIAEGHHYEYYVPSSMPDHGIEFDYMDNKRGFTYADMSSLSEIAEAVAKWTEKYTICEDGYFTIERYDTCEKTLKISSSGIAYPAFGSGLRDLQFTRLAIGIISKVIDNYNDEKKYHQSRLEAAVCFALTIHAARELDFTPDFSTDIDFGDGILKDTEELIRIATEVEKHLKETDIYHLIRYPDYVDPNTHVIDAVTMLMNTEDSEAVRVLTEWWNGKRDERK